MKKSLTKAVDDALFEIEQDVADLEEDVDYGLKRKLIIEKLVEIREKLKILQNG
ncbi:MAG: hypothetical protein ACOCUT_00040 [bacterium]